MNKIFLFLSFPIIFSFLLQIVYAQLPVIGAGPVCGFLGIQEEFCVWPDFFWLLILPYFSTLFIIYGLFEQINIFRDAEHKGFIYLMISLGWAALLVPTGFLGYIAHFLYQFSAFVSVGVFMVLLFFGLGVLVWSRLRHTQVSLTLANKIKKDIDSVNKEIEEVDRDINEANENIREHIMQGNLGARTQEENRKADLLIKKNQLEQKHTALFEQLKNM